MARDKGKAHAYSKADKMSIKDFKRECVVRGMPFSEVIDADVPKLYSFWIENLHKPKNPQLLDDFDDWVEKQLRMTLGEDAEELIHPSLRLGFIGERDDDGMVIKMKRIAGMSKKPPRKKKQKTSDGVIAGTAKAKTFECFRLKMSKQETEKAVLEQFPDASPKSIGIWYNKAKRKSKV